MTIAFKCTCGRPLEVLDELAGKPFKCRVCGATVTVPEAGAAGAAPGGAPAAAAPPAPKKCIMCRDTVPPGAAHCPYCGWDSERGRRCCLHCGGAIEITGGLSIRHRCRECGRPASPTLLSDAEKREIGGKKTMRSLLVGGGLAAAAAVTVLGIWIAKRPPRVSSSPTDQPVVDFSPLVAQKGEGAIPELITYLQDERNRWGAVDALAKLGKTCVPALGAALQDKNPEARKAAATALGRISPNVEEALPDLIAATRDAYTPVRHAAIQALAQMGPAGKPAGAALVDAVRDADAGVKEGAIAALAQIQADPAEAVPVLIEALRDAALSVRVRAAETLGQMGVPANQARSALEEAAQNDAEPAVRHAAAAALKRMTP